ncbi:hypothetical protein ACVIHD_007626 [Bradyrhizobium embrapense]
MHVGRGALVHHLGLALRVEVLRDVTHDADELTLPALQARRGLLEEIEDVLLRQAEQRAAPLGRERRLALGPGVRHRPPQIVEHGLLVLPALAGALLLGTQVERLLAGIAVDAMRHQRMRGIQRPLHRLAAVAVLAGRDVALGEFEIIEDAVRIGPLLEQIVVLEEVIVPERRVRDHQRLHRRGVLLHQIRDARRGVDHDLIGEAHQTLAIGRFLEGELLAERPVLVEQRHADRGIGVEHLLGGDHLDLVGIDVEPEFLARDLFAGIVNPLQRLEIPVGALEQAFAGRPHQPIPFPDW